MNVYVLGLETLSWIYKLVKLTIWCTHVATECPLNPYRVYSHFHNQKPPCATYMG